MVNKSVPKERVKSGKFKFSLGNLFIGLFVLIAIIFVVWLILPKEKVPAQEEIATEAGVRDNAAKIERAINDCIKQLIDYEFLALLEDDLKNCEKADDNSACTENYYIIKAVQSSNEQFCENAGSLQTICKGIIQNDASVCDVSQPGYSYCKALIARDVLECDNLESDVESCKEDTLLIKAVTLKNSAECNNIEEPFFKSFCRALTEGNKQIYIDQIGCT